MEQYFLACKLTPEFILEVLLGYLVTTVFTGLYIYLLGKIGVEPGDTVFLEIPTFDRVVPAVINTVILAPLEEEVIFRGLTSLLFGVVGIIMGTVAWAAAHIPSRINAFSAYPISVQKKATAILLAMYLTYGVYFSWLWVVGAGLIAVFMHFLNNAIVVLATYRRMNKKHTDMFEERPKEENDIWIDKNPSGEPVFLKPITDPSYFKVIAEGDEVKVVKTKKPEKPPVAGEIRDTRLNILYIDRYVKEKYEL